MNNDDISHFSTIPASFAIKSNVYFITHQYLIINNSQSQRALSVSVRTGYILLADETVVFYLCDCMIVMYGCNKDGMRRNNARIVSRTLLNNFGQGSQINCFFVILL